MSAQENGWLIESQVTGRPMWWTGIAPSIGAMHQWSDDSLQAVRFSRRVDAEMVIVGVLGLKLPSTNVLATEHGWG